MAGVLSECSFAELIQSDLFTFHIGEKKKQFLVHSSAIAATSEPFRALVNGSLVESKTRSGELEDVEPEDFVRFLEYAYRRNYTVPSYTHDENADVRGDAGGDAGGDEVGDEVPSGDSPIFEVEPQSPPPERTEAVPESSPLQLRVLRLKAKKRREQKKFDMVTLRSRFQSHVYLPEQPTDFVLRHGYETQSNSEASQDYTPVFLAHARLYTFADMRLIYPLKKLALGKLHKTLMVFQLYTQRVGDIVELARYAYDNGPDRSDAGDMNELRQLVVEYMACEVDTIGKNKEFKALLEDGGEFVSDFWGIVSKYLM